MQHTIRHEQNMRSGMFYILSHCERIAYLAYTEQPTGLLQLTHTFVSDSLRGQGIAGKLTQHAMDYAVENNLKVLPVCPYIIKWLENKPDYSKYVEIL